MPDNELPQIEDAAELISKPIVLPDDVIDGIVHRGGKIVFGGASKSFKTWLLTDLAVSVATGAEWLRIPDETRARALRQLRIPARLLCERIAAICDERQITLEAGLFDIWNLRG